MWSVPKLDSPKDSSLSYKCNSKKNGSWKTLIRILYCTCYSLFLCQVYTLFKVQHPMQSVCFSIWILFSREIIYKDTTRNEYHATTWLFICKSLHLNMYFVYLYHSIFFKEYQYSILLTESELSILCYISATIDLRLGWSTKTLLIYRKIRANDTCSLIFPMK